MIHASCFLYVKPIRTVFIELALSLSVMTLLGRLFKLPPKLTSTPLTKARPRKESPYNLVYNRSTVSH